MSALLEAVKAHLLDNDELLLAKGADPNGMPLHCMDEYSTAFVRRSRLQQEKHPCFTYPQARSVLVQRADLPQCGTPTQEEMRAQGDVCSFTLLSPRSISSGKAAEARTALEVAAESGDLEIIERLMHYSPDISFRTTPYQLGVSDTSSHSSLSTINPLTIAI